MMTATLAFKAMAWRTERSGEFGGFAVSGWRYAEIAIWHMKISVQMYDKPEKAYVVTAGEFYPDTASEAEKVAMIHLISQWETEGVEKPSFAEA
jgi:hypothetical protein